MSTKILTSPCTANYWDSLNQLSDIIDRSEMIVVGAGAGLSAAAGFQVDGERFRQNFSDFIDVYHFTDMYSAGFYPFPTIEEYWGYWSRYIYINRYQDALEPVYTMLRNLLKGKNYFVITTNVDHCFQKSGFDKSRLFYMQGDYGLYQCSAPCHNKTYDNEQTVYEMVKTQRSRCIPSRLVPRCQRCGALMTMNLRSDEHFAEDDGWHAASVRCQHFLEQAQSKAVLYLELGVGENTPGIIKVPFWKMTAVNSRAVYACLNQRPAIPAAIRHQSLFLQKDLKQSLSDLASRHLAV